MSLVNDFSDIFSNDVVRHITRYAVPSQINPGSVAAFTPWLKVWQLNPCQANVKLIKKPVNRYAVQINWLVSICSVPINWLVCMSATLAWYGLKMKIRGNKTNIYLFKVSNRITTLEKGVKYVVRNKNTRTTSMTFCRAKQMTGFYIKRNARLK